MKTLWSIGSNNWNSRLTYNKMSRISKKKISFKNSRDGKDTALCDISIQYFFNETLVRSSSSHIGQNVISNMIILYQMIDECLCEPLVKIYMGTPAYINRA